VDSAARTVALNAARRPGRAWRRSNRAGGLPSGAASRPLAPSGDGRWQRQQRAFRRPSSCSTKPGRLKDGGDAEARRGRRWCRFWVASTITTSPRSGPLHPGTRRQIRTLRYNPAQEPRATRLPHRAGCTASGLVEELRRPCRRPNRDEVLAGSASVIARPDPLEAFCRFIFPSCPTWSCSIPPIPLKALMAPVLSREIRGSPHLAAAEQVARACARRIPSAVPVRAGFLNLFVLMKRAAGAGRPERRIEVRGVGRSLRGGGAGLLERIRGWSPGALLRPLPRTSCCPAAYVEAGGDRLPMPNRTVLRPLRDPASALLLAPASPSSAPLRVRSRRTGAGGPPGRSRAVVTAGRARPTEVEAALSRTGDGGAGDGGKWKPPWSARPHPAARHRRRLRAGLHRSRPCTKIHPRLKKRDQARRSGATHPGRALSGRIAAGARAGLVGPWPATAWPSSVGCGEKHDPWAKDTRWWPVNIGITCYPRWGSGGGHELGKQLAARPLHPLRLLSPAFRWATTTRTSASTRWTSQLQPLRARPLRPGPGRQDAEVPGHQLTCSRALRHPHAIAGSWPGDAREHAPACTPPSTAPTSPGGQDRSSSNHPLRHRALDGVTAVSEFLKKMT